MQYDLDIHYCCQRGASVLRHADRAIEGGGMTLDEMQAEKKRCEECIKAAG